jgi:ATP-dependent exoDNAse (exonuclease V) beta subunit
VHVVPWHKDAADGRRRLHSCLPTGTLVEGVLDLAFREKDAWTVVDFKTDREFEKELAQYKRQVGLYALSIERATGEFCGGVLMRI